MWLWFTVRLHMRIVLGLVLIGLVPSADSLYIYIAVTYLYCCYIFILLLHIYIAVTYLYCCYIFILLLHIYIAVTYLYCCFRCLPQL